MSDSKSFQLALLKPSYSYTPVTPRDSVPSVKTPKDSAGSSPAGGFFDDSRSALVPSDAQSDSRSTGVVQHDASSRFPQGWRFGATFSATGATCVLLVNFVAAIWAYFKAGKRSDGYVYEGNCGNVDRVSIGVHLLINVLSTLLLGSSNYIQQCLSAPTRREVDLAHLKGIWLEIGQPSLRNLRFVPRWKPFMWIFLALSSLPLHLFYNSIFYSSLAHNDYDYYFASEKFFEGAAFNTSEFPSPGTKRYNNYKCYGEGNYTSCLPATYQTNPNSMQEDALRFDRLENEDCIRAYAQDFLAARRNLVLVVDDLDNTTSSLYDLLSYQIIPDASYVTPTPDPYYWICSNPSWYWGEQYPVCSNALSSIEAHASNWTVYGHRVRYCQSESVVPKCRLNFNLPVLVVVIVFNAVKVVCICFVARRMRDQPMITLGDAVASFLRSPDATTKGMCLATRAHFQRSDKGLDWSQAIESPMTYKPQKMRWMRTASIRHWVATVFLFVAALATVLGLLGYAVPHLKTSYGQSGLGSFWSLGLGKARSQTMITGWSIPTSGQGALISAILVANSPQFILSLIYVVLNSLATRLLLAREWSGFARLRKPLRVSNPQGDQRCTYFLQIPYRYGMPLMLYSTFLHWLVSQSIYLAKVDTWSSTGVFTARESITTCGFSPIGMILTSIVTACLILTAFVLGLRQLGSQIPFAGSCSAAISAACHAQGEISETAPLKWGVVPSVELGNVGHCAFSSGELQEPVPGNAYA